MKPIKLLAIPKPKITAKPNLCDAVIKPYPAIRPRVINVAVLSKIPTQPLMVSVPHQRTDRRHAVILWVLQVLNAIGAGGLGFAAWYYLATRTTFLVVSFAIIVILWVNFLCAIARRRSIDMKETMEHPALKVWSQRKGKGKKGKALYMESTNVYLKAIKASFVGRINETH